MLTNESDNGSWDTLKESMVSAAEDVILPQERKTHNKWMTEEILGLMGERQKISNRKSQEYREMDKVIKSECSIAKEKWLNSQCERIEKYKNSHSMHKEIKKLVGNDRATCSSSGCIKSRDGDIVMDQQSVLKV